MAATTCAVPSKILLHLCVSVQFLSTVALNASDMSLELYFYRSV